MNLDYVFLVIPLYKKKVIYAHQAVTDKSDIPILLAIVVNVIWNGKEVIIIYSRGLKKCHCTSVFSPFPPIKKN